ncbi:HEAT repeat domain-containing protein [Halobacteriovorax vibrionivorans]|uniref:HEAT repeat domain-containing protein n=1 Tax=Halobacteriovorax vibrionivorans TaxID=2152716 RepID=A0ABY0IQ07_9BACT|nr:MULTISPECIES: HEAT repeat domain-containing protein [Halobacteriovorax]RZF23257.1 HEAT repeat domain-containing protein [Halobacteriovorax vibrionivorans]TGD46110.1 HEAT repeat domain-containing protein [Halobacteriovorax sp. Y22]
MSEKNQNNKLDKKLLESNPVMGSLMVPIAIVLVGALIIFGVTKMLSNDHSYKDLVHEMKSKTFGNKWIAALELSKVISAGAIEEEDIPWVVENLKDVYRTSVDPRTRDFVVVAIGALGNEGGLPVLESALKDKNHPEINFHAMVALSKMPKGILFNWDLVKSFLGRDDAALTQVTILTLATHEVKDTENLFVDQLKSELGFTVRYAAATALIAYKNDEAKKTINEILMLNDESLGKRLTVQEIRGLKYNVLTALKKYGWNEMSPSVEKMINIEKDIKVVSLAKEVLNSLK